MTKEEAIKGITSLVEVRRKYVGMQTTKDEIECLEMAIKALEQEPKEGHWEYVQYDYNFNIGNWHCSECRTIAINAIRYKYCPNCGAKMKVESEDKK